VTVPAAATRKTNVAAPLTFRIAPRRFSVTVTGVGRIGVVGVVGGCYCRTHRLSARQGRPLPPFPSSTPCGQSNDAFKKLLCETRHSSNRRPSHWTKTEPDWLALASLHLAVPRRIQPRTRIPDAPRARRERRGSRALLID